MVLVDCLLIHYSIIVASSSQLLHYVYKSVQRLMHVVKLSVKLMMSNIEVCML